MDNKEFVNQIIKEIINCPIPKFGNDTNNIKGENAIIGVLTYNINGLTPGELKDKLGVTSARIAAALNDLETKEYISRLTDENDKRRVIVKLTPKGLNYSDNLGQKIKNDLLKLTNELGQATIKNYFETTRKIREILEKED